MWQCRFAKIVESNSQTVFEVERINFPESGRRFRLVWKVLSVRQVFGFLCE
jgi:hypothetical protein